MSGACSVYGGGEKYLHNFCWKPGREEDSEDLGVGERVILKWVIGK
jgi:hypothetical protein